MDSGNIQMRRRIQHIPHISDLLESSLRLIKCICIDMVMSSFCVCPQVNE